MRNFKLSISLSIVGVFLYVILALNDDLTNYFASILDFSNKKTEVKGSNFEMRYQQFVGSLNEIKGNELVGKGYSWTSYYMNNNGTHPIILAFESLFFVVICNSGMLGSIIWIIFFFSLFLPQRKLIKIKKMNYIIDSLVICYFSFSIVTGEYGYLRYFIIFYCFLIGYIYSNQLIFESRLKR